jgi:hypothetical protein
MEYADDIAILISGKFPNINSELLQQALSMVHQWCDKTQLSINPQTMVTAPLTRKKDLTDPQKPNLFGQTLQLTRANTSDFLWTRIDMKGTAEKRDG